MYRLIRTRVAAAGLTLVLAAAASADEPAVARVEVVGTEFRIVLADGTVRRGQDLVGTVLALGGALTVRIDSAELDPLDPEREVWLYGLSAPGAAEGTWVNLCTPGPDGLAKGFPLSGTWTAGGEHLPAARNFSLTCTSGADGKCVRMGYKPWKAAPGGQPLWDYHQACVRLLRADYCGDGTAHTRPGIRVNIYDRIGVNSDDTGIAAPGLDFEAAWGAAGAVCVRKTRIPELITPDSIRQQCPARLADRIGEACTEERARDLPEALLFNRS